MRKDAERNRERLLEAADRMFRERGIDVSVGEIAGAAGLGRATLFRNFASKHELIAAVLGERVGELLAYSRRLLEQDPDDAEVTFTFATGLVARLAENRALMQAATDELPQPSPALARAHTALLELMGALLARGKRAGAVRPEATATDLMALIKGVCVLPPPGQQAAPETVIRQLDLVRAALTTPAYSQPLRGRPAPLPA